MSEPFLALLAARCEKAWATVILPRDVGWFARPTGPPLPKFFERDHSWNPASLATPYASEGSHIASRATKIEAPDVDVGQKEEPAGPERPHRTARPTVRIAVFIFPAQKFGPPRFVVVGFPVLKDDSRTFAQEGSTKKWEPKVLTPSNTKSLWNPRIELPPHLFRVGGVGLRLLVDRDWGFGSGRPVVKAEGT